MQRLATTKRTHDARSGRNGTSDRAAHGPARAVRSSESARSGVARTAGSACANSAATASPSASLARSAPLTTPTKGPQCQLEISQHCRSCATHTLRSRPASVPPASFRAIAMFASPMLPDALTAARAGRLPPLYLLHGEFDEIVPVDDSTQLSQAAQAGGTEATLVVVPAMDHGWSEPYAWGRTRRRHRRRHGIHLDAPRSSRLRAEPTHPDGPITACCNPGHDALALTNAEFLARVKATATMLRAAGLGPGDVTATMLTNRVELVVVMFATWRIGAALTPINPSLTAGEAGVPGRGLGRPPARPRRSRARDHRRHDNRRDDAVRHTERRRPVIETSPDALALLIYTSGTTGKPNGVMLRGSCWDRRDRRQQPPWFPSAGRDEHLTLVAWTVLGTGNCRLVGVVGERPLSLR